MTEAQLREKVVSIMTGWLGCKESNGSHKKIIDTYNKHKPLARNYKVKYTDHWCATTVSAAFIKAGLTDIAPTECSCAKMIDLYKKIGRWQESDTYKPQPGDVIMYDWNDSGKGDNTGHPEHVGIVVSVSGNIMKVIEGNKNESVCYRTMTVGGKYIRGYCLPDYASKATKDTPPQKSPSTTSTSKPANTAKVDPAKSFSASYAKTYTVTAYSLHMRAGAGITKKSIKTLPAGSKVTCYGYYTKSGLTTWLYVKDSTGATGFCSKNYLK